ncbi:MAG: protein adenylyltransferase SelO family protein [Synechococcus sp. SP2 MAG]|nr:protein adenylyltransferase SelO family protein [Synechococcus sp. SP2 MAG]
MSHPPDRNSEQSSASFNNFIKSANYSLLDNLHPDPESTKDGDDHRPRQVRSGHFVPVTPKPLPQPTYISHSKTFFSELGLDQELALNEEFKKLFSGDLSEIRDPMHPFGWATGYALSIYGTEYNQQCPFGNGNGYGDGRAISVFEGVLEGQRWEMQLKGGGPTPYCRGADGRAVLRSSVREFLAQDLMHALGVPTSRSLTLYVSQTETVRRPWYSESSNSSDPDILVEDPVAISTRVAPSFIRVGQLELFARRARTKNHPDVLKELRMIVMHLIDREYKSEIDQTLDFPTQLIKLAELYRDRLTTLVAHWLRIGYCQGNFNSDNCAAGGFTLDYGPFGFCEVFDPRFQPWIGGGEHFSFFNQPVAAEANFHMFWKAIRLLIADDPAALEQLDKICDGFKQNINTTIQQMWADKLGLAHYNETLVNKLFQLMVQTKVDFTIFFRELCKIPKDWSDLKISFYASIPTDLEHQWQTWLQSWNELIGGSGDPNEIAEKMKRVNPKYTWREWLIAPAYQQAKQGDYALVKELQEVFSHPYEEQSQAIEEKYYRLKPAQYFNAGGISHYSCSS